MANCSEKCSRKLQNIINVLRQTFCILNGALSPSVHVDLISKMKPNPYTLATDGSNDSDITKMNTLTLKIVEISLFYQNRASGLL